MIRNIATYLQAQGLGTKGTDLFVGVFPSTAVSGTAIMETGPEMPRLMPQGIASTAKQIQLLTKGPNYESTRQTARAVAAALLGKSGLVWSDWHIHCIDGGMPQYVGQDEKHLHNFSANLTLYGKEV